MLVRRIEPKSLASKPILKDFQPSTAPKLVPASTTLSVLQREQT